MPEVKFNLSGILKILLEEPEQSAAGAFVTLRYGGFTVTARGNDMSYKLPVDNALNVKVKYVDRGGNEAAVDGDVTWGSSDDSLVEVVADPDDSMSALVQAKGKTGQAQVTASADADLGEGTRTLITTMDVEVVPGEAVAGTIEPVGEPIPPHAEPA